MAIFRYHFSTRDFYHVDVEAKDLEEAIEALEYAGVHYQNEEKSDFLDSANVDYDMEDRDREEQWEIIGEDVSHD